MMWGREPLHQGVGIERKKGTGIAKYSDIGRVEGYISETVQDSKQVSINH